MKLTNAELIFQVIGSIPNGHVATYGQVAELAGLARAARLVGSTLKKLPKDTALPWHRVVNASGRTSLPPESSGKLQKERLEEEGVVFLKGRIDLKQYQWNP